MKKTLALIVGFAAVIASIYAILKSSISTSTRNAPSQDSATSSKSTSQPTNSYSSQKATSPTSSSQRPSSSAKTRAS